MKRLIGVACLSISILCLSGTDSYSITVEPLSTQTPTHLRGPVSFPIQFTSTTPPDSSGNERLSTSTETFSGTIGLRLLGTLVADEDGCLIRFSGDDGTTFCITEASFVSTLSAKGSDKLLLIGTGDFSKPLAGGTETGPVFLNSKGSLKRSSGDVVSISLSGSMGGGASRGDSVFRGNFKATLAPVSSASR